MKNSRKSGRYVGRYARRRKSRRTIKTLLPLCLTMIFVVCLSVGGTLAYMQAETNTVTNSFKAGDITYTLNLEANAENVTMPGELTPKDSTALSVDFETDKDPAKTGYTFGGWYYDEDCTEEYKDVSGQTITVKYGDPHDSDEAPNKVEITLYAKWTANTYTVEYMGNGSTGGSMDPSTHIYDVESKLTKNTYVRTGYAFLGWSEDENATTATYADQAEVMNLTSEPNGVVTLYAVWKQMDFQVSFDTQTYDVANPAPKTVTFQQPYGELPEVSRNGYTFNGWTLDKEGKKPVTKDTIVEIAGNHTLYGQWTPITYTVKYDANAEEGITGSTASSTHTYDEAKKLTANGYSRTGYTFTGWNTKPDGTGKSYRDEEFVTNLTSVNGDTVTLYAQWGAKSYVLRYHANGGEGTMEDQIIKYDEPTTLYKNEFTKDDHSFMGWALTPDGDYVYIDEQIVVNLLESGTLDLYAVWAQDSHTVYFDYNGGTGSPASKQFQYGKAYGQLPEYPVHPTKVISENEVMSYLFTGWYTEPTGGTRVYASNIANRKEDHTLYAHWEEAPTNNVIKDIVVKNNPDDNGDGVVDDVYLNLKCSSNFEKFNIPLKNLIAGQTYRLTYTASNDASFGDYYTGYAGSVYGSYIVATRELTGGRIDKIGTLGKDYFGMDLLATWNDRIEPDGNNDGSQAATNDSYLQGPWKNRTITFTATQSTMYWTWDFGLMQDGILDNYNMTDIVLEPVAPEIKFAEKTVLRPSAYNAKIVSQTNGKYSTNFTFDGDGGCETVYYPITGLNAGSTYTITFDHKFTGALINSSVYDYGCGIMNTKPADNAMGDKMSALGTWASNQFVYTAVSNTTESVTLTFKATGSTAYWVWNMANCSDDTNCTIDVKVTKFSAQHTGGSITYHDASSKATLEWKPDMVETQKIILNWDGIDDTNMELWYPVDEQNPVAGEDYEMAFEPMEGYKMAEIIAVAIDDVNYDVYTDGRTSGEAVAPVYNPETNVLTIPGDLLTAETKSVAITASAVKIEKPTEPSEPATEPSEPATEPSEPATEPSEPATEPSEPATEPSEPATEPSEPATEPSEPATEPSEPATEPSEPATEPSKPTPDPSEPTQEETVAPTTEATLPPEEKEPTEADEEVDAE